MVEAKRPAKLEASSDPTGSDNGFSKHSIVIIPLAVLAVFSLGYVQLLATNNSAKPAASASQTVIDDDLPALPLIVQPNTPQLNTTIETIAPPLTNPPSNPYAATPNDTDKRVGPSSTNAGYVLQSVGNNLNNGKNDALQAPRKNIRLENVKL